MGFHIALVVGRQNMDVVRLAEIFAALMGICPSRWTNETVHLHFWQLKTVEHMVRRETLALILGVVL